MGSSGTVKATNLFVWLWSLVQLTFVNALLTLTTVGDLLINRIILGWTGRVLIFLLLAWGLGYLIQELHRPAFEHADKGFCLTENPRTLLAELSDALALYIEIAICFWNLALSWGSTLLVVFFELTLACGDRVYLGVFRAGGLFGVRLAEGTLGFALDPLNNTLPIFSPQGSEEAAMFPFLTPDEKDIWHPFVEILNATRPIAGCMCEDSFINGFYNFIIDRLSSPHLGCALDRAVNAGIRSGQQLAHTLITFTAPDFSEAISTLCDGVLCAGAWFDEFLFELIAELYPPGFDLRLGCVAARAVCFLLEAGAIVQDLLFRGLFSGDIAQLFAQLDFTRLTQQGFELAQCVDDFFSVIDRCVGELAGGAVRLLPLTIQFTSRLLHSGEFDFDPLVEGVLALLGNSQYDLPGAVHVGNSGSANCPPHCDHQRLYNQTALTCIVAKILGDRACSRAAADLGNSVAALFLAVPLTAQRILQTDFSNFDFQDNPLNSDNRDNFNRLVLDIICVFTDRIILVLDQFGHFVACIPGLGGLGDAIVAGTEALDNVVDDLKELLLIALELIAQTVIWIISLFGADPFGANAGEELITFFSLFFDLFTQVFDLVLEIVKGLIDYVLFPWFPALFGQGTMLSDSPGTARFTYCFEEFGDCICGITKALGNRICLPAGIGCLGTLWPNCDDFEPSRRRRRQALAIGPDGRVLYDGNVFEYWSEFFGDTYCGEVFHRWSDNYEFLALNATSVGERDGSELLNCISAVESAGQMSAALNLSSAEALLNPQKLNATGHDFIRGFGVLLTTEGLNLALSYADPAAALGRPEGSPVYIQLAESMRRFGVADPTARVSLTAIQNSLHRGVRQLWSGLDAASRSTTLLGQSARVAQRSLHLGNRALASSVMILQEFRANGVIPRMRSGLVRTGSELVARANARRQLQFESYQSAAEVNEVLVEGHFPFPVTRNSWRNFRLRRVFRALQEYKKHLVGDHNEAEPMISPAANSAGEVQNHKPNSCTTIYVNCSIDLTNVSAHGDTSQLERVCTERVHYANFRVCNDLFDAGSHAVVTNCTADFQAFAFYNSLADCRLDESVRPPPTRRLLAAFDSINCLQTLDLGFVCITGFGCSACPVDQILPGFQCSFADEVVHRMEYLTRRCIDKLGLGPPLPTIPENLTSWFSNWEELAEQRIPLLGHCGDGIVDSDRSYQINNPVTGLNSVFPGEQCDPPDVGRLRGLTTVVFNSTICGAHCQFVSCGNGVVEGVEQCDDGNNLNGDGCDAYCRLETCGNGILNTGGICQGTRSAPFSGRSCNLTAIPIWRAWNLSTAPGKLCGTCSLSPQTACVAFPNGSTITAEGGSCGTCLQFGRCNDMNGTTCTLSVGNIATGCANGSLCVVPNSSRVCGRAEAACGFDSRLFCRAAEECDDGNRLPNDGCDQDCQLETCPDIRWDLSFIAEAEIRNTTDPLRDNRLCAPQGILQQGRVPDDCFYLGGTYSAEMNCKARQPVLWLYDNAVCDGNQRMFESPLLQNCLITNPLFSGQEPVCVSALFNSSITDCAPVVQTGLEFTCVRDCAVCGDGIMNGDELCDDGTRFLTGVPSEDVCVNCRLPCDCPDDPNSPCYGFCEAGPLAGITCNPRNTSASQCAGFRCTANACCGNQEFYSPLLECNWNPQPANATNNFCVQCSNAGCECQPDLPCFGVCYSTSTRQPVRGTDSGGHIAEVACDMRLEPFACPLAGQYCVPQSCCGDGEVQSFGAFLDGSIDFNSPRRLALVGENTNFPDNPCESSGFAGGNCPSVLHSACNYYQPFYLSDPGYAQFRDGGLGLPRGRRDACQCHESDPCLGRCYTQYGYVPAGPIVYCDRSFAVSPFANSTNGNADCESQGIVGGICGAISCCGDGLVQTPYEAPASSTCVPDGCPSDSTAVDLLCGYANRWFFYGEVPNASGCPGGEVGRCSFYGEATELLCDPSADTPWCPHISNHTAFRCYRRACCGDGVVQAWDGVNAVLGGNITLINITLESCELPNCRANCELFPNIIPNMLTQCEPLPGFGWSGLCTDPTTGHTEGVGCGPSLDGNCTDPVYSLCLPEGCCGDGVFGGVESCDIGPEVTTQPVATGLLRDSVCTSTSAPNLFFSIVANGSACHAFGGDSYSIQCSPDTQLWNLSWFGSSTCTGAPSVQLVNQPVSITSYNVSGHCLQVQVCGTNCSADCVIGTFGLRRRQLVAARELLTIVDASPPPPLQPELTLHKPYTLTPMIKNISRSIFQALGSDSNRIDEWKAKADDLFSLDSIDINLPPEERGVLWYAVFPFYCRNPENFSGEGGIGILKAALWVLVFLTAVAIVSSLLFGPLSNFVWMLVMAAALSLFLGLGFFYAWPGCWLRPSSIGRLSESIGYEVAAVFAAIADRCFIYWPSGLVLEGDDFCPTDCGRHMRDCREVGFVDGFDNLAFLLEVYFPNASVQLREFTLFNDLIGSSSSVNASFARWNLHGAAPTELERFCFWLTIPLLAQVLFILVVGGVGLFAIASVGYLFVSSLVFCCWRTAIVLDDQLSSSSDDGSGGQIEYHSKED